MQPPQLPIQSKSRIFNFHPVVLKIENSATQAINGRLIRFQVFTHRSSLYWRCRGRRYRLGRALIGLSRRGTNLPVAHGEVSFFGAKILLMDIIIIKLVHTCFFSDHFDPCVSSEFSKVKKLHGPNLATIFMPKCIQLSAASEFFLISRSCSKAHTPQYCASE
jgi:hypothetical protein